MSTGRLPDREQRALEEMERALRRDFRLQRRLRRLTRRSHRPIRSRLVSYTPRPWTVVLLLAVAVGLMVAGIITSERGVIWAFAAVWPVALYAAFRLLCRCTEP